jgi:hypothetical protein
MASYGQNSIATYGGYLDVSADGSPEAKAGGVTIDWATVAAPGADVTLPDGQVIPAGVKYLRYGQVVQLIGVQEVQTVTFTGGPTAGNVILTVPVSGDKPAEATGAAAFNVSAAALQTLLEANGRVGVGGVTVGRTGTGTAGDPYIYTLTFSRTLGNVPTLTQTNTFTGGTTPTATVAVGTDAGATAGKYGPYDSAATDGRQNAPARGVSFVIRKTTRQDDRHGDHPIAIYGGLVYRDRILATGGTHSLAAGPTWAELEAAFPRLADVEEH